MKRRRPSTLAIALAFISAPFLVGCGSSGSGSSTSAASTVGGMTCTGSVCYPTSSTCLPLNQAITFAGTGLTLDQYDDITGGVLPGTSTSIGTVATATTQAVSGETFVDNETSGQLEMAVQSAAPGSYAATTANVNGQLMISTELQEAIMLQYPNGISTTTTTTSVFPYYTGLYGYYSGAASSLCVSGLALQAHLFTGGGISANPEPPYEPEGGVYLYLNNTQEGYVLYFY